MVLTLDFLEPSLIVGKETESPTVSQELEDEIAVVAISSQNTVDLMSEEIRELDFMAEVEDEGIVG